MAWRQTFFMRRTFEHPDGRMILVWEDTARDHWIVEARPAEFSKPRPRWTRKTEQGAADLVWFLMGTDEQWGAGTVWQPHAKPKRWH